MNALEKILVVHESFNEIEDETPESLVERVKTQTDVGAAIESGINFLKRRELELEGAVAKIKPLMDELNAELKFHSDRLEYAKKVLMLLVPPGRDSSYVTDLCSVFYTPSESTEIFDPQQVPIEYQEFPEPKPSASKIKEALKSSIEVPGARLIVKYNLRIGAGGERGKLNDSNRKKQRSKKIIDTENMN